MKQLNKPLKSDEILASFEYGLIKYTSMTWNPLE